MDITKALVERAVKGVVAQGSLAFDIEAKQCQLRTSDGLKCAVGQLIADEHYRPSLEIQASPKHRSSIAVRHAIVASNPDLNLDPWDHYKPYWKALSRLQGLHDNAKSVQDFAEEARELA